MTDSISSRKITAVSECGDPTSIKTNTSDCWPRVELAALVGGSAGAVIGLLGGAIGVAVGAVVGALACGLTGQAIADFGDPTDRNWMRASYTTHSHYCSPHSHDDDSRADNSLVADTPQARREAWSHLDETSKDLIRGCQAAEANDF